MNVDLIKKLENNANNNDWSIYRLLVIKELERLDEKIKEIDENIKKIEKDIVELQIKAGVWGLIAGAIPPIVGLIFYFLSK